MVVGDVEHVKARAHQPLDRLVRRIEVGIARDAQLLAAHRRLLVDKSDVRRLCPPGNTGIDLGEIILFTSGCQRGSGGIHRIMPDVVPDGGKMNARLGGGYERFGINGQRRERVRRACGGGHVGRDLRLLFAAGGKQNADKEKQR